MQVPKRDNRGKQRQYPGQAYHMQLNLKIPDHCKDLRQIIPNKRLNAIDMHITIPEGIEIDGSYGVEKFPKNAVGPGLVLYVVQDA